MGGVNSKVIRASRNSKCPLGPIELWGKWTPWRHNHRNEVKDCVTSSPWSGRVAESQFQWPRKFVAGLYSYPLKLNFNAKSHSFILNEQQQQPPLDSAHPNLASLSALQMPPPFTTATPPSSAALLARIHSPTPTPPLKMARIVSLRFYFPIYPSAITCLKFKTE